MTEQRRPLRVLVVEGQPLFCDLLTGLVRAQSDMRVVAVCGSAEAALALVDRAIDVALIGPRLPDGDGISLGHALRAGTPRLGIIVLFAPDARDELRRADGDGGPGWAVLSKNLSLTSSALVFAIRAVAAGRRVLDPSLVAASTPERESPLSRLSPRQREVLALVADGLSNAAIAHRLAISPRSVEAHLRASYAVLGIGSDPSRNARVDAARTYLAQADPLG